MYTAFQTSTFLLFATLLVCVWCQGSYQQEYAESQSYPAGGYNAEPQYPPVPPKYNFNYAVNDHYTGVDFSHGEQRDGYLTNGKYHVSLPDGRVQRVSYKVDQGTGYLPDVQYEGEAQYPEEYNKPAPYQ